MNITINELSRKTGISSYEIRLRIKNGTLPHIRVGAKRTKVLVDEDVFTDLLLKESINNAKVRGDATADDNSNDDIGYDRIRRIG